jgi:hypothetical protein
VLLRMVLWVLVMMRLRMVLMVMVMQIGMLVV